MSGGMSVVRERDGGYGEKVRAGGLDKWMFPPNRMAASF